MTERKVFRPWVAVPRWLILNGLLSWMLVIGATEGVEWARNGALYCLWAFGLLMVLALSAAHSDPKAVEKWRLLPRWYAATDQTYDLALVIFLASVGWTWSAMLWTFAWLLSMSLTAKSREPVVASDPPA